MSKPYGEPGETLTVTSPGLDWRGAKFPIRQFDFPDGQPHVAVTRSHVQSQFLITARIRNGQDLLRVLLANEALRADGAKQVDLFIKYLLGARMDRRMESDVQDDMRWYHPFTLRVVAQQILSAGFDSIKVLDPHSDVACALLNAEPVNAKKYVQQTIKDLGDDLVLVAPDAGAIKRVESMADGRTMVTCLKHRNTATGELSSIRLASDIDLHGCRCLIVDDLCDGGRTFSGVADCLRVAGATETHLYVTHGLFTAPYGVAIPGIASVTCTDSYQDFPGSYWDRFTVIPVEAS